MSCVAGASKKQGLKEGKRGVVGGTGGCGVVCGEMGVFQGGGVVQRQHLAGGTPNAVTGYLRLVSYLPEQALHDIR